MNKEIILSVIDNARKTNKNKWYSGSIHGGSIQYRGFNTWLQVLNIDGIDHSSTMELSVKEFRKHILESLG